MKQKKMQLAGLCVVLVAVIVAGVWLLTGRNRTQDAEAPADSLQSSTGEIQPFDLSSLKPMTYHVARSVVEDDLQYTSTGINMVGLIFFYQNQACCFDYSTDGDSFSLAVVSLSTGETLHTYEGEAFYDGNFFETLCLDQDGVLWAVYLDYETGGVTLASCGMDDEESSFFTVDAPVGDPRYGVADFLVWDGWFAVRSGGNLSLLDTSSGTAELVYEAENVRSCCLDEDGNLYFLAEIGTDNYELKKYSLEQGTVLWRTSDQSVFRPYALSYTAGGGLFLWGSGITGKIMCIDPETGAVQELTDLSMDLNADEPFTPLEWWPLFALAVDSQYRLYFDVYDYDLNNAICRRELYVLEPDAVEIDPADRVTLTITAPYPVDSIAESIRLYQRSHPEVDVVWDTQYLSREDFQLNTLEYKEQLALRIMTGDAGDLVMVTGSGLGTEVMMDTDAFADLSGYLAACPFLEELPANALEALRGADGAIRGLPLAVQPTYYVWNAELLETLGVDPEAVTWSELLDLALQWQTEGVDLSLTVSSAGQFLSSQETGVLQDLLLANLYDAEQPDGSVQLDQPYLRELLTKFEALHGSTQLIRRDGDMSKALFVGTTQEGMVSDRISAILSLAQDTGIRLQAAPCPMGEMSGKRQGYAFCWAVSQVSENRDAAWDLLQFLASGEGFSQNSGYTYTEDTLPLNTAAQTKWSEWHDLVQWSGRGTTEQMQEYFQQIQSTIDTPYSRFDQPYGWYDAVYVPIEAYINGNSTLDKAMETANANWERFLLE